MVIRLCMFPLVVKAQKNAVVMNNNLPRLQSLHMKMIESRQMGNEMEGEFCCRPKAKTRNCYG